MRTLEISVGFFIVFSVVALLILALQVSGLSQIFESNVGYEMKAQFSNIGGLKVRGKVVMAGVVVGRVTDIKLNMDSYEAVVTMRVDEVVNKIPDDSRASILTAGLLGDNYIGIMPGFSETYFHKESVIPIENTDSAVVLENLISKFITNRASKSESDN